MKKPFFLIFFIFLCFSDIYAQSNEDTIQNILSNTIDKYTRKTPPFPIIGKWSLLIPKNGDVHFSQKEPKNYEDIFYIIRFEIIDNNRAKVFLDKSFNWIDCSWEHALFGAKFYINIDSVHTIKIIYYLTISYIEKNDSLNKWESIFNTFKNGDNEYQIALLSYQLVSKENLDEDIAMERDNLKTKRTPSSTTTIPVLIGILENGIEMSSSQAVMTHLQIN